MGTRLDRPAISELSLISFLLFPRIANPVLAVPQTTRQSSSGRGTHIVVSNPRCGFVGTVENQPRKNSTAWLDAILSRTARGIPPKRKLMGDERLYYVCCGSGAALATFVRVTRRTSPQSEQRPVASRYTSGLIN